MKILCIDGYNFLHRSRSGFQMGPHYVAYNFFRGLKALVEQHKPTRVYFVLEGVPRARNALMPEYKANRIVEPGSKKEVEMADFHKQKDEILKLASMYVPISLVRHPDFEGDDVVYNLIKNATSACEWTVVSNDTDFIQLLNEFKNVRLYNPMKKTYVETPAYDYVTYKSLKGDGSDNIPGIPGIGEKTALKLVNDPEALKLLFEDQSKADHFIRNHTLIRFHAWNEETGMRMQSSAPAQDWDAVKKQFDGWGFRSMTCEPYWTKFVNVFDPLWG